MGIYYVVTRCLKSSWNKRRANVTFKNSS